MTKQNNLQERFLMFIAIIGFMYFIVITISFAIQSNKINELQQENEMLKGQIENYSCRIILTDTVELDILNWNKPIVKVLYYFISEKERNELFLRYNLKEEDCDVLK